MSQLDHTTPRHPIRVVARRTGLKADLIRAWERRYSAIEPRRTAGKHRLYSDADIERLILLRRATTAWRNIGQVAKLSDEALRQLAEQEEQEIPVAPVNLTKRPTSWRTEPQLEACIGAISRLDTKELNFLLERAAVDLNPQQLFGGLLTPLMREVGRLWNQGELQPMHEHLASATIRSFVGALIARYPQPSNAPNLIVTTPIGQRHELGALLVAAVSAAEAWQVAYLGVDLAAHDIAAAARARKARAVALSLVYPTDDPVIIGELHKLAERLDPDVSILVGGQAAAAYRQHLKAIQAIHIEDFSRLRELLIELRKRPRWRPSPDALPSELVLTKKNATGINRELARPRLRSSRRQIGRTQLCVSRRAYQQYEFEADWLDRQGQLKLGGLATTRRIAERINRRRRLKRHPLKPLRPGELHGAGLVQTYLRQLLEAFCLESSPALWTQMARWLAERFGRDALVDSLKQFSRCFNIAFDPASSNGTQQADASDLTASGETLLREMLLLFIANQNPAFEALHDLIDDQDLEGTSGYREQMLSLQDFFAQQPGYGPNGQSVFDLIRAPIRHAPDSLQGQLEILVQLERELTAQTVDQLLIGLDVLKEEEGPKFVDPTGGGGPPPPPDVGVLTFDPPARPNERLSQDQTWMANAVVMAKNVYVWLAQLSAHYQQRIERLDQIPDQELEQLVQSGITDLWLVGFWQRSQASKRIKQQCGDPEAEASAYALTHYRVARQLGGEIAFEQLLKRATAHGLRLACDIVPNHMGIDSTWVIEHPEWFLSVEEKPFPGYTFDGPDLSPDPRIGIFLEDHYYDRSDASVVFKRVDRQSNEELYLYHGNDGTGLPWNDTAQLNYLQEEVRRAVSDTIISLAKRFPVIRVDAAMTLVKKHVQRLWFPAPGQGGAIPSRAENGLSQSEFDRMMSKEFWRDVVDRLAIEAPGTMLVAEGFWLLEDFFIRELGVHRVYNSAFMHMLRDGKNQEYRSSLRNALRTDPRILQRLVNFLTNPDETPAAHQFGTGERYFSLCTLLVTLPGLPLFGHGQFEGLREKYGMEYNRPRTREWPDVTCLAQHEKRITPLLGKRELFAGVTHFRLFDCQAEGSALHEDVIAFTNRWQDEATLVFVHNRDTHVQGRLQHSSLYLDVSDNVVKQETLISALGLANKEDRYFACRDVTSGLEFAFDRQKWMREGLAIKLGPYEHRVLIDFRPISSAEARRFPKLDVNSNID